MAKWQKREMFGGAACACITSIVRNDDNSSLELLRMYRFVAFVHIVGSNRLL